MIPGLISILPNEDDVSIEINDGNGDSYRVLHHRIRGFEILDKIPRNYLYFYWGALYTQECGTRYERSHVTFLRKLYQGKRVHTKDCRGDLIHKLWITWCLALAFGTERKQIIRIENDCDVSFKYASTLYVFKGPLSKRVANCAKMIREKSIVVVQDCIAEGKEDDARAFIRLEGY